MPFRGNSMREVLSFPQAQQPPTYEANHNGHWDHIDGYKPALSGQPFDALLQLESGGQIA